VLVDGKIAEDGPPSILKEEGGVFADLWKLQTREIEAH